MIHYALNGKKPKAPNTSREIKKLYETNGWDTDPTLLLLAMTEELGEIAGRWLAEHPGYKKGLHNTDPIPEEIGDLLHLILAFCNTQGINYEECIEATITKRSKQT